VTILSFTGTRRFTFTDMLSLVLTENLLHEDLGLWSWVVQHEEFVTGGCVGFDAVVGATLARWPQTRDARHTVILPANRSQVDAWYEDPEVADRVTVIEMPEGTSYRDRDLELVKRGDELCYVADYPEHHGSQRRSGTWLTVRLARGYNLPIRGIVLHEE
jgi:hypothetical protein